MDDINDNANLDSQDTDISNDTDTEDTSANGGVDYESQYKTLQTEFLRRNEELKELKNTTTSLSDQLKEYSGQAEVLNKIKSVFSPEEAEDAFSWQKVPDLFEREKSERARLEEENKSLGERLGRTEQVLQSMTRKNEIDSFTQKYSSQFETEDDFNKALDRVGELIPDAEKLYTSGQRTLDSLFAEMIGAEMANPDSELIKSMERAAQQRALKKQSNHIRPGERVTDDSMDDIFTSIVESVPLDY